MTGSSDAADQLADSIDDALRPIALAVSRLVVLQNNHRLNADLIPVLQSTVAVIMAVDALEMAADAGHQDLRRVLAVVMNETGATSFHTNAHTISLRDAVRSVVVTDANAVLPRYLHQPPPAPNKVMIAQDLRKNIPVAGCELSNGGAPSIQIRNRK